MKRGGYLKRKTPLRSRPKRPQKRSKIASKGFKPPKWYMAIPTGSHGNTPAQKRYWKVVSDMVRQRDFKKYKGRCVSCPKRLGSWKDGDAGHYKAWSVCNSYFKYELTNLALQCKNCNRASDGEIGHRFGEELKRRYGEHHLLWISEENERWRGVKMETHEIVERVEKLLDENPEFICP